MLKVRSQRREPGRRGGSPPGDVCGPPSCACPGANSKVLCITNAATSRLNDLGNMGEGARGASLVARGSTRMDRRREGARGRFGSNYCLAFFVGCCWRRPRRVGATVSHCPPGNGASSHQEMTRSRLARRLRPREASGALCPCNQPRGGESRAASPRAVVETAVAFGPTEAHGRSTLEREQTRDLRSMRVDRRGPARGKGEGNHADRSQESRRG